MEMRKLGVVEVSAIGYGCMGLSYHYGPAPEHDEAIHLIRHAYECGCRFFDTAESYGAGGNERLVGEAISPFRDDVVLATKIHLNARDGKTADVVRAHLDASLKRLGTDYVDIYYQHRIEDDDRVEKVAEVMGELIAEGKIRGWGQSMPTEGQVRRAHRVTPLAAVQSEYSMMMRGFEKDVMPACEELGIGFVSFSPLASGFLSGRYTAETRYRGDDLRADITLFAPENVRANQGILDVLRDLADAKDATPAQISLAWMLRKWPHVVPIPGSRTDERIEENLGAGDVRLTDEEFFILERSLENFTVHGGRTDEDIKNATGRGGLRA